MTRHANLYHTSFYKHTQLACRLRRRLHGSSKVKQAATKAPSTGAEWTARKLTRRLSCVQIDRLQSSAHSASCKPAGTSMVSPHISPPTIPSWLAGRSAASMARCRLRRLSREHRVRGQNGPLWTPTKPAKLPPEHLIGIYWGVAYPANVYHNHFCLLIVLSWFAGRSAASMAHRRLRRLPREHRVRGQNGPLAN
jgi:hypothetical protein